MMAMRKHVLRVSEVEFLELCAICQGFVDIESVVGGPERPRAIVVYVSGQTAQVVTRRSAVVGAPSLLQDVNSILVLF